MNAPLEQLVAECRTAVGSGGATTEVLQDLAALVAKFVEEPQKASAVLPPLVPPTSVPVWGLDETLYEDSSLSVVLVDTPPGVLQPPHDHRMAVAIGVYEGVEDHRLYNRDGGSLTLSSERSVNSGEMITLESDVVHAIAAGDQNWCRAIHIYLGSINTVSRSIFDPETFAEEPLTMARYEQWCRPMA